MGDENRLGVSIDRDAAPSIQKISHNFVDEGEVIVSRRPSTWILGPPAPVNFCRFPPRRSADTRFL